MEPIHKNFLEQLQSLDEPMKKKVLVVSTAVIMVIVVYFWLAYFNTLIAGISNQPPVAVNADAGGSAPAAAAPAGPNMLQRMGNGLAAMYTDFKDILRGEKEYDIKPQ